MSTSLAHAREIMERQQSLNQRHQKRLARKIHDEISQKMTLLSLQLSLAATEENPPGNWAATCQEWSNMVMDLGQSIRDITGELQPRVADEGGLKLALRWLAQSVNKRIPCAFREPQQEVAVPVVSGNALFGLCREIISDILLPASVAKIEIVLEKKDDAVRLVVRADDSNIGKEAITRQALDALESDAVMHCLEGSLDLQHSSSGGSVVTLTVPVTHEEACPAH